MEAAWETSAGAVRDLLRDREWIRRLARSLVRDEHLADDVEQQAWVRILESPPRHGGSLRGWAATVVRNLVRDAWKTDERRRAREGSVARRPVSAAASDVVARADTHRRLIRKVLGLAEPYRTAVLLRFFDDLSPKEIAARLGTPPATVRTHVHRALAMLRDDLRREDPRGWHAALLPLAIRAAKKGGLAVTAKKTAAAAAILVLLLLSGAALVTGVLAPEADEPPPGATATAPPAPEASDATETAAGAPAADSAPETRSGAGSGPSPSLLVARILRVLPIPGKEPPGRLHPGAAEDEVEEPDPKVPFTTHPATSKWAPVPLSGTASVSGRVVDEDGRPLEGARVLRVHLMEDGEPVRRHGWIYFDRLGHTDAHGRFEFTGQPAGTWRIAADWHAVMYRTGHLDLSGSHVIAFAEGEEVGPLEIRLPLRSAKLASVRIEVVDAAGNPLGGNGVRLGERGAFLDRDGTWTFRGVEPGRYLAATDVAGFAQKSREVDLRPGENDAVRFRLERAESGPFRLAGRVVDRAGAPVSDASVWYGTGSGDSRHCRTAEGGSFAFEGLPERPPERPAMIVVNPPLEERSFISARLRDVTVPGPDLEIVVERLVALRFRIRDGETGAPVPLFNLDVRRWVVEDGEERLRPFRSRRFHSPEGAETIAVPAGRLQVTVEAKDHRGVVAEVVVPDLDGPKEIVFELDRE